MKQSLVFSLYVLLRQTSLTSYPPMEASRKDASVSKLTKPATYLEQYKPYKFRCSDTSVEAARYRCSRMEMSALSHLANQEGVSSRTLEL